MLLEGKPFFLYKQAKGTRQAGTVAAICRRAKQDALRMHAAAARHFLFPPTQARLIFLSLFLYNTKKNGVRTFGFFPKECASVSLHRLLDRPHAHLESCTYRLFHQLYVIASSSFYSVRIRGGTQRAMTYR